MANLTSNTTSLQEILAKVNELPEAGNGNLTSLETCEFTFSGRADVPVMDFIYLNVGENGSIELINKINVKEAFTVTVPKGSFIEVIPHYSDYEFYIIVQKYQGTDYPVGKQKFDGRMHYFIPAKTNDLIEVGLYS